VDDERSKGSWHREGGGPWYWRSTLSFLTRLPERSAPISDVFLRHAHSDLGGKRNALDHLSWLVEIGEISPDASIGDAIAAMKRLHRIRTTHDRRWQQVE
jgi:hypothetical protein